MFATRSDLLARCSARRLAQLAVPTDVKMVLPEDALRVAISGGTQTLSADAQRALDLGLANIDQALQDADALVLSHGIPRDASNTLIARICSSIALWYLQGAERMSKDVQDVYDAAIGTLKSHARGDINLLPNLNNPALPSDQVLFGSSSRRYRGQAPDDSFITDPDGDTF